MSLISHLQLDAAEEFDVAVLGNICNIPSLLTIIPVIDVNKLTLFTLYAKT